MITSLGAMCLASVYAWSRPEVQSKIGCGRGSLRNNGYICSPSMKCCKCRSCSACQRIRPHEIPIPPLSGCWQQWITWPVECIPVHSHSDTTFSLPNSGCDSLPVLILLSHFLSTWRSEPGKPVRVYRPAIYTDSLISEIKELLNLRINHYEEESFYIINPYSIFKFTL